MAQASDSPRHADVPGFVTDDWLAARLRRLSLETGAAPVRRELEVLAGLLERDLGGMPERTVADLTDDELLNIFPGGSVTSEPQDEP
jgi:hypothetical protein